MLKTIFKGFFKLQNFKPSFLKHVFIGNLVLKQFVNFTAKYTGAEDLHCVGLAEKFLA